MFQVMDTWWMREESKRVAARKRGRLKKVRWSRQVGCLFLEEFEQREKKELGKMETWAQASFSGDVMVPKPSLVEATGELVSGRCRRGCDAAPFFYFSYFFFVFCAPPSCCVSCFLNSCRMP
jgi:hypothetical protein